MNSNTGLALSIVQNYPEDRFNLLVPMVTVTEIAEIQKRTEKCYSINIPEGEEFVK